MMIALNFCSSYTTLPQCFYAKTMPDKVTHPKLVIWNESLAAALGLSLIPEALRADYFSGNALLPSSEPIALAYAGHQFGHFTMLGDGRAHIIGEIDRLDIQLKGSGQTPFSRQGDGKATIGPMLREYLISEAMHALGIPTTRSLAVVDTGELVYRDRPLPGAVLTRISQGHLRVGTFEYAARQSTERLKALVDYAVNRHEYMSHHPTEHAEILLANVITRQAALIAKWMLVGFVHGVMNTDNMSMVGETIDYGPCAFMNEYRLDTVFSSIDHHGRYAYGNQPSIALWNLTRLAEALLPLTDVEVAKRLLSRFIPTYQAEWLSGMRKKLGLQCEEVDDLALAESLLNTMAAHRLDLTRTFRELGQVDFVERHPMLMNWHQQWKARLKRENAPEHVIHSLMCAHNPYIIPRNSVVEAVLEAVLVDGNIVPFQEFLNALQQPFCENEHTRPYYAPPQDPYYQTFCGT